MKTTALDMAVLKTKVVAYKALNKEAGKIDDAFEETLSKKCKYRKVWVDPFDGEPIPKCYKVGKGKRREYRMECTITNCPL